MEKELEKQFKEALSKISEKEKGKNKSLAIQTKKILMAIDYLKHLANQRKAVSC